MGFLFSHLLHDPEHLGVHGGRGGHDALVLGEGAADGEVEPLAGNVGDVAAGLAHNEVAGGVVPDLLLVGGADGQAQVNVAGAAGDAAVLALAVHADAGAGDAEALGDLGLVAVGAVAGLDALAEGGGGHVGQGPHGDGAGVGGGGEGEGAVAQGEGGGALALDGGEEHAAALVVGGVGAHVGRQRRGVVDGQVRAAEDADLDVAVDHEAEAHGVLAAAQEALGAVDGVNGPDAALGAALAVAGVDEVEHFVGRLDAAAEALLGGGVTEARLAHEVRAAEDADLDVAVDHEAEAHGVLAAAQEALGAVDGVNGPDAALGAALAVAGVDEVEHFVGRLDAAAEQRLGGRVTEARLAHEVPDLGLELVVLAQLGGLLLGDNLVFGEVVAQGGDDEGLGAKVANGDGGLVILVDGALGFFVEDALREDGGALDGELGDLEFFRVGRHGGRLHCWFGGGGGGGEGSEGHDGHEGQVVGDEGEPRQSSKSKDSQDDSEDGEEKKREGHEGAFVGGLPAHKCLFLSNAELGLSELWLLVCHRCRTDVVSCG
ncbi:hypothetical protein BN1723_002033 [Verticillium longisporum]|uniref:Uncharacterized protein n=1 Tax=Verticillium longisporum TaxID=100787 RepID=A0A0G4KVK8_VERLO|nr:hypothetical protein BN1723_002033 [Verticillium longisporum]